MGDIKSKSKKNDQTERAVYAGRRLNRERKTIQCFVRSDGEKMYFAGIKGVHLGYTYECGKGNISVKPKLVSEVPRVDDAEWDAADALVDARNYERRAEKKLADSTRPALKNAIEALAPLLKNLDYLSRKCLVDFLVAKSSKYKT